MRAKRTTSPTCPVFLVLTKCDVLAKPDDTFSKWQQRIEEAKRSLVNPFAAFLTAPVPASGTVNLQLWATRDRPTSVCRSSQTRR